MNRGILSLGLLSLLALPLAAHATTWTVGQSGNEDFSGLTEACATASAGDSLLISPGYYDESVEWIMLEAKPLSFIGLGTSPDDTGLNLRLSLSQCMGAMFQNLCIRDATGGTPVFIDESEVIFRNCIVRDNRGPAIRMVTVSEATIEDCVFSRNRNPSPSGRGGALTGRFTVRRSVFVDNAAGEWGGAIDATYRSTIEECVFFRNEAPTGAALSIEPMTDVRNCTFLANRVTGPGGGAIQLNVDTGYVTHCIIAGTIDGYGVACPGSGFMECCDFWDNDAGDFWSWDCYAGTSIYEDPLFCDPVTGDVGLLPGSPCLPGNHGGMECDLIGAKGLGCGQVPVRETTWGRLKMGYR